MKFHLIIYNKANRIIIIFSLFCAIILACNNKAKRELEIDLKPWENKEIIFPLDLQAKIFGKDTVLELSSDNFKILNYIDTTGCTECRLELYEWTKKIEEIKKLDSNTEIIFIIHLLDYLPLEILLKKNYFNYPVYYDPSGQMDKINKLPKSTLLQTFLLDKNNKVVLIGNPIRNPKIWELYKKVIKDKK